MEEDLVDVRTRGNTNIQEPSGGRGLQKHYRGIVKSRNKSKVLSCRRCQGRKNFQEVNSSIKYQKRGRLGSDKNQEGSLGSGQNWSQVAFIRRISAEEEAQVPDRSGRRKNNSEDTRESRTFSQEIPGGHDLPIFASAEEALLSLEAPS